MKILKILKILIYILILVNFFFFGFLYSQSTGKAVYEVETANLTKAVDGDTIETSIGKSRMLGINTPEKNQRGYEEAKAFLQQFEGMQVELERTNEDKDQYGRILRYVFYNNRNLNEEILEQGFAHYYAYTEDKYTKKLKAAEEKAIEQGLGIWEKSNDSCADCMVLVELNNIDPGEYITLGNKCDFSCNLAGWTIDDDASSHTRTLDFTLNPQMQTQIDYEGRIWNDAGDSLYLKDNQGFLVLFYRY